MKQTKLNGLLCHMLGCERFAVDGDCRCRVQPSRYSTLDMFGETEVKSPYYLVFKRAVDLLVSFASLTLLSPLFLVISLLIKFDSRGPVFYRQQRIGFRGKLFEIWKFRTMVVGAEKIGHGLNVIEADPRITRIGAFLRRFSLDELPQLLNILQGEMSLVGPRPGLPLHLKLYDDKQARRLEVKPGLTGLAQISGRAALSWPERIELDLEYVKMHSFKFDLWIIFQTIRTFLDRQIYNPSGGGWDPDLVRQRIPEGDDLDRPEL